MLIRSEQAIRLRLSLLCLLLLLILSCGSKDQYIGTYQADPDDSHKPAEIVMELKANGAGIWRVNDDEVPFAWYIKGGELRVNTKGGGSHRWYDGKGYHSHQPPGYPNDGFQEGSTTSPLRFNLGTQ